MMIEETGLENNEYFQQEDNEVAPKKKLRRLTKKRQSASPDKGPEIRDDHSAPTNSNNSKEFGKVLTYQQQVEKLSEQIALMDAKRLSKPTKKKIENEEERIFQSDSSDGEFASIEEKKNNSNSIPEVVIGIDNNDDGDDDYKENEDKNPKKKQNRKSKKEKNQIKYSDSIEADANQGLEATGIAVKEKKKQVVKKEVEKNEDMLKRLANKFDDDEEYIQDAQEGENDEDFEQKRGKGSNNENTKKIKSKKSNEGSAVVKSKNKLFGEINIMETQNLMDNIEEQPVEEEYQASEESIKFERQPTRYSKNIVSFLQRSLIYKKERGLDVENSQTKLLKESSQNSQTALSLQPSNNPEEKSQTDLEEVQSLPPAPQTLLNKCSQDKKINLLRSSSKNLSQIMSQSSSQEARSVNSQIQQQHSEDQLDIELLVPHVDSSQKLNKLVNNTLFFSKISRGPKKDLLSSLMINSNLSQSQSTDDKDNNFDNPSLEKQPSINNQPMIQKKGQTRQQYLLKGQQRITEKKSQGLNIEEVQNRFKQTTLESLEDKVKKEKKLKDSLNTKDQNQGQNEDSNKAEGEEEEEEENNQSQEEEEDQEKEDEEQDDGFEEKQRQLIEAEIQYRKLLAVEEGIDEKQFEKEIRKEYGLEVEEKEDEDNEDKEDLFENEDGEEQKSDDDNDNNLEDQLVDFEDGDNIKYPSKKPENKENEEMSKPMKRLKNIAAEILKKQKVKDDIKKQQKEKRERKRQLLNNPIMKKLMGDMIEDEAELGSDNEENDDKIKNVDEEDEYKQVGLKKDEDLDAELEELIDNKVQFDDENERLATAKFVRDLARRDKEEIQKIILGAYKGQKGKKRGLADMIDEENGENNQESKRLKRIQDAILLLQNQNEDEYEDNEDGENENEDNKKRLKKDVKKKKENQDGEEEEELMKVREANLILKKEYQKQNDKASNFNEQNLVDPNLLRLLSKSSSGSNDGNNKNGQLKNNLSSLALNNNISTNSNNSNGFTSGGVRKVQAFKISDQTGIMKGNLCNKNSVLHVKNNKNRLSQFNDSFNKDSLINEFGESAISKTFAQTTDNSESIFYSKNNQNSLNNNNSNNINDNNSNSKPFDKTNNNNNNNNKQILTTKTPIPSLNKLFKSNTVLSGGPSANTHIIFGRKREPSKQQQQ